jgi:hypothetical protein
MQFFKGDSLETKIYNSVKPLFDYINAQLDQFLEYGYTCRGFGYLLYDTKRAPLAGAIGRDVFARSFVELFEAYANAGTFEGYILLFKKIFGESADVTFTVSAPGKLQIAIEGIGSVTYNALERRLSGGSYAYSDIVDRVSDNIYFRESLEISSEYELQKVIYSLVPNGIYTTITATIG